MLGLLVAGLLRSHADILRALHSLGAGVGDPATADDGRGEQGPVSPVTLGPPLPGERQSSSVHDVAGVSPDGDGVVVSVTAGRQLTLLVFLSSGCSSCAGLWQALGRPTLPFSPRLRLVVVTKGPAFESSAQVAASAPQGVPVVMSTEAWDDYEVPGAPFFVLVDGAAGRRIGEGVASRLDQVADLVRRAEVDRELSPAGAEGAADHAIGLDGPARERANDLELRRAGVLPGDPSLYPRNLGDVYGTGATDRRPA